MARSQTTRPDLERRSRDAASHRAFRDAIRHMRPTEDIGPLVLDSLLTLADSIR